MTLYTIPTPDAQGSDGVAGASWNTLVAALTGGNTEPITIGGVFKIKAGIGFTLELTHAITANRVATFPDNTGTVAELNLAQTWTAIQTFPTGTVVSGAGDTQFEVRKSGISSIFLTAANPSLLNVTGGVAFKLQQGGNDIITLNANNIMDFNSRLVNNLKFGNNVDANGQRILGTTAGWAIGLGSDSPPLNGTMSGARDGDFTLIAAADGVIARSVVVQIQSVVTAGIGNPRTAAEFSPGGADGETALLLSRNIAGTWTLQRVSMGAVDSGGAGFKLLRVPN